MCLFSRMITKMFFYKRIENKNQQVIMCSIKKRLLLGTLFLLSSSPFYCKAQEKKGYTIHGYMEGLKEGEKVVMMLSANRKGDFFNSLTRQDSGYVKNGEFFLTGYVPDGPRRYMMIFDKHDDIAGPPKILYLYIDNNEHIIIRSGNIDKIPHQFIQHYVDISGSPTNYSMMCLEPAHILYNQSIGRSKNYIKSIADSIGFNGPLLDAIFACRDHINLTYYINLFQGNLDPEIKNANLLLVTEFSSFQRSGHAWFWKDFYNNLDEQKRNSYSGKWLKGLIALCVGQPFPEFSLPKPDGKLLSSKEIIAKSKITLINFWSTNSLDRKELLDELLVLYKKYHDKGFNIISVSKDKYLEEWNATLNTGQYPWVNVIDRDGYMVEQRYFNIKERTTNILVDNQGKIVAWDINGPELQWYLWKTIGE